MMRTRAITDTRSFGLLAAMLGVGILFAYLAQHVGGVTAAVIVLLVPCLLIVLIVFPMTVGHVIRSLAALRTELTWWHGLWMLVLLSELVFRIRDSRAVEEEPVDAWAIYRIALVGIVAFILGVRLALKQTPWVGSLFRGLVGALSIYAFVAALSSLWSVYPAWTLYKSLEYLVDLALVAAILATVRSAESFRGLFDWTWTLYGLIVASIWFGALVWPSEAFEHGVGLLGIQLSGVVPIVAANSVGEYGAVLAIVALVRFRVRGRGVAEKNWYGFLFVLSLLTLIFSQTRSALGGFLLAVAIVLFWSTRQAVAGFVVLATTALVTFTGMSDLLWTFIRRGESPELFNSLSGRVDWWQFGWEKFLQHPWTGLGAYAGARFAVLAQFGAGDVSGIHNTYIEAILGTSIWGLIPVVVALVGTWCILVRALRHSSLESAEGQLIFEALAVLAVITVRTFFTSHIITHTSLNFLVLLTYAEFLRRRWKYEGAKEPAEVEAWDECSTADL